RAQRLKLAIASVAIAAWSIFLPVIYKSLGSQMKALVDSGVIPKQLTNFGGGDVFSLSGSIAVGFIHPIAIILVSIFAVGFATSAVAGERQRGTLEVILARPISRRSVYLTFLAAALVFIAIVQAAAIAGTILGTGIAGVASELQVERLPLLWFNGVLFWGTIGAIGLAASVSFDRLGPAFGITLALVVVSYFLEILGSLWPDAKGLQPYSLFHYLTPRDVLNGVASASGFALLAVVAAMAIGWALFEFPRRDLAAPS
ncbi:MAG: ABC transporter permease subunit, partial [Chloroflexi bacterium]|nr:ABC transporter permease subunit [Chloroflexota bacterium]